MRGFRTLIVGSVAVLAAAFATTLATPTPAGAVTPPAAPYTALVLDGGATSQVLDPSNATFSVQNFAGSSFSMMVASKAHPTITFRFMVYAYQGTFGLGTHPTEFPSYDGDHLSMMADWYAGGCSGTGTITVLEMTDTAFAATFEIDPADPATNVLYCSAGEVGQVRWNSGVGYKAAPADHQYLNFGGDATATTIPKQSITVTGNGTDPITFGTAAVEGTNPAQFTVTADSCSGVTLALGQTCTMTVGAFSDHAAIYDAVLKLPDNSNAGEQRFALQLTTQIGMAGTYYPLTPTRLVDTRSGEGSQYGAKKGPLHAGGVVHLHFSQDNWFMPANGISAVVLNVTVTSSTSSGYLTLYPTGKARPTASSVNYAKGWTGANSVTVATGTGGNIDIYSSGGNPQLIVDIVGIYAGSDALQYENCNYETCGAGGQFRKVQLQRILDTRLSLKGKQLSAGYYQPVVVNYGTGINPHIRALAVNVTAVGPKGSGYLTTWGGSDGRLIPGTSTVNYAKGHNVPNMAIVPVAPCDSCTGSYHNLPAISVYTPVQTDVVIDIVGIFDDGTLSDGLRFNPLMPSRIADSRYDIGTSGALGPGGIATVAAPASVLGAGTEALALNITAVAPSASTYVSVWPAGDSQPTSSTLNPAAHQTVPNAAISFLGAGNAIDIYNHAGTTDFLVDVVGNFYLYPPTASAGARSPAATQSGPANLRATVVPMTPRQR